MPPRHPAATPDLLEALAPAVRAAGRLIEDVRAAGVVRLEKADLSPVTEADTRAEALLEAAIRALDADTPIVGEEAVSGGAAGSAARRFWLLDPLDGTASFCDGGGDYTVNVGLIEDGAPVLGLVLHPPTMRLWAGCPATAWLEADGARAPLRTRPAPERPVVVVSHNHLDAGTRAWLARLGPADTRGVGSSLKFCLLAEGAADVYPRLGPTSEWDTAAADAVLRAAGGMAFAPDGAPFHYGKPGNANGAFLALGDAASAGRWPALR